MKKVIIPSVLAATILVAGMFAFMPVQRATTVHNTITSAIDIQDIFATASSSEATVDVIVVEASGAAVTNAVFSASAIVSDGADPGSITVTIEDSGNGVYRLTLDPANGFDNGRTDIALQATADGQTAWALVVIEI